MSGLKKGDIVTATITAVVDNGLEVMVNDVQAFIRKSDLAKDRGEQRPDRFAEGEKVDAKVNQIDRSNRRVLLSIKALEVEDEQKAMEKYGSSDSGASLGDILGAALEAKKEQDEKSDD